MSEEGECVVSCCFSRGFNLLGKQEEQELDFRTDFASGHGPAEGIEKFYNGLPQRQIQLFPPGEEPSLSETGEEFCWPGKYHTCRQWKRRLRAAKAESESISSGKQGSKCCHIPSPRVSSPLTQTLIYMRIPPSRQIFH